MNNEILDDITDTLEFDTDILFTEENTMELLETIFYLIDEYITNHPDPDQEPDIDIHEELKELFFIQLEDHLLEEEDEDFLEELIEYCIEIYDSIKPWKKDSMTMPLTAFSQGRKEEKKTMPIMGFSLFAIAKMPLGALWQKEETNDTLQCQIELLRNIEQPKQRTPEWYNFRNNMITASNAYKALDSESKKNQLIYEKCKAVKEYIPTSVNIDSSLHWGQKYEPLSVMIYEKKYDTKIEDFGCIRHPVYDFLGASPDGINVKESSSLYGRMLEIKNVVSRVINGIPKKEYWVQMQLQMEVCNLDKCDFLETKFIEYDTYKEFIEDQLYTFTPLGDMINYKGVFLYFHNSAVDATVYIYKPLEEMNTEDWIEKTIELYEKEPYLYTFIRCICWKLEVFHCMLVERDRRWFQENIGKIEEVWRIIEKERVSGYEHRMPKSRRLPMNNDKITKYLFVEKLDL
jgi:putative phage-type endonuclease